MWRCDWFIVIVFKIGCFHERAPFGARVGGDDICKVQRKAWSSSGWRLTVRFFFFFKFGNRMWLKMELISDAIRGKRKLHVVLVRSAMKTSIANNSNKNFPVAWLEFKCIFESPNRIPFTWKHCRTHFRHKVTVATTQSIQSIRFNYKFRFEINLPGTDDVDCNPCQRFTCHRQFHFEFSLLVIASNSYTTRVEVEKKRRIHDTV